MTTASKAGAAPRTIDEWRRELAQAERTFVAVCADGAPGSREIAEARAVLFAFEEFDRTKDRDAALARGAGLMASTSADFAEIFDRPGALHRGQRALVLHEADDDEQCAKEAEAHAPVVAAREALYAALADETRGQWREYVPILASAAGEFYAVLARAPRGHPDGADVS